MLVPPATMMTADRPERRHDLARFIRAHRERLTPAAIGLPAGSRRRTPGLRREEVAQLCGLSTTWYTWIEQGRDVSVSPEALTRLAGVLRLDRAERAYLFGLAGKRDPAADEDGGDGGVPGAALAACVAAITAPAYLLDRRWDVAACNAPARHLFAGWLDRPAPERNLLRFVFLDPAARSLILDWERRARRVAAEFRAACGAHLHDPALRALVEALRRESPEFGRFWDEHEVLGREGGERTFRHPVDGLLRYEQVTFALAGHPDLRLTMLVDPPRGTAAARP